MLAWWEGLDAERMRPFWVVAGVVIALQVVGLCVYSTLLYRRFDLSTDFATYAQSWYAIGHGHLDPVDTVQIPHFAFWQSHFELAMWPLSLLRFLWPQPVDLLWLQDVAIGAAELVTAAWIARVCAERLGRARNVVAVVGVLALVANPWWYETASFDVHFETLGLPLVVLAGYALWRGRRALAWSAGGLALLFGDVVAVSVVLVGLAGLLSARVRRRRGMGAGLGLVVVGIVWLAVVFALHANRASAISVNYGYLVHAGPRASSAAVLGRLVAHPSHALHVLANRWHPVERVLASAGLLGVVTPWGLVMAVGTLVPVAINANPNFIEPVAAFQSDVVIPFVLVGTVMVLVALPSRLERPGLRWRLGRAATRRRLGPVVVVSWTLGVAALASAGVQTGQLYAQLRSSWWKVDAPAASALSLARSRLPEDAEVIASSGVMGGFYSHAVLYPLEASPQAFTVDRPTVVFVVAAVEGVEVEAPAAAERQLHHVYAVLHARLIVNRDNVSALEWHPPPGTTAVVLP